MTLEINWIGEAMDTCAKLLGKYGTWLQIKKNKWGFVTHITCCIYWVCIDLYRHLYSQALFTIPTIVLLSYGFYKWNGKDE